MAYLLSIAFLRLGDLAAMAKGRIIKTMLAVHPLFQGPFPDGVLSPDQLGALIDRLFAACDAATCRDSRLIILRNSIRKEFNTAFRNIAHFLEIQAAGDLSKLLHTGFDTRQMPKRIAKSLIPLVAPVLDITHGLLPGTMVARMSMVPGALLYELQFTLDPTHEENWAPYARTSHRSHIDISDRTPGLQYWFRSRGIGDTEGPWSPPFPLISL